MFNRGGSSSRMPDAMKIGKSRMQSNLPGLHNRIRANCFRHILLCVVVIAFGGTFAIAQTGAQTPYQQAQPSDQQNASAGGSGSSQACYLGGSGPVPGSSTRSQGMALPQSALSQMQASNGGYARQADTNSTEQSGEYEQHGGAYSTDQPAGGQTSDQTPAAMSADEIISILQQAPELLTGVKTVLAQGFGVDPSTISDDGVYNCIRQDANFRSGVTAELRDQGYSTNQQETNPAGSLRAETLHRDHERTQASPEGMNARFPVQPEEQPSEVLERRPIPYPNLPSLIELYSQVVPANGKLRRFGSETFQFGTGNVNQLPMDLPAGPDYVLGPGDSVVVNMWGVESARLERVIDRQGQIALPAVGTVTVTGLTMSQAQSAIQAALGTQFQNEHVELSLGRVRTVRVYVVGDVQRPGAYDVSSLSTALNALYAAGGPTSRGSLRTLKHYRGQQLIREIDLYDLLLHGVRSDLERLLPGDTILVPPVGTQVTVAGMVRRPAIYELKSEQNLNEVLTLAGGLLVSASLDVIDTRN